MGKQINNWTKKWIDMIITNEPKTIYRIYDDLYDLLNLYNRTRRNPDKGYRTGRHIIPTTTALKRYLSKEYESVVLQNDTNFFEYKNNIKQVRHYFRKEEQLWKKEQLQ